MRTQMHHELCQLIKTLSNGLINYNDPYNNESKKVGGYPYITFSPEGFLNLVVPASSLARTINGTTKSFIAHYPTLLDVGCGVGVNLQLAHEYFRPYGLEINDTYIKKAHNLFGSQEKSKLDLNDKSYGTTIFKVDIRKYRFYDKFDAIFLYEPLTDWHEELKLEKMIVEKAKIGCIFLNFRHFTSSDEELVKFMQKQDFSLWRLNRSYKGHTSYLYIKTDATLETKYPKIFDRNIPTTKIWENK